MGAADHSTWLRATSVWNLSLNEPRLTPGGSMTSAPRLRARAKSCYVAVMLVYQSCAGCVSQQHTEALVHTSFRTPKVDIVLGYSLLRSDASGLKFPRIVLQIRVPVETCWKGWQLCLSLIGIWLWLIFLGKRSASGYALCLKFGATSPACSCLRAGNENEYAQG